MGVLTRLTLRATRTHSNKRAAKNMVRIVLENFPSREAAKERNTILTRDFSRLPEPAASAVALSPFQGSLTVNSPHPKACAVGCILSPLRGSDRPKEPRVPIWSYNRRRIRGM